jgi:hypothetical protein
VVVTRGAQETRINTLFDALARKLVTLWKPPRGPRTARSSRCRCGRPVFFANSRCTACEAELGYEPELGHVFALEPAEEGWRLAALESDPVEGPTCYRRCASFESPSGCNWLVPKEDHRLLCRACRLNRTIPDLSQPGNPALWRQVENARRRLIAQLISLGLPVASRVPVQDEDPRCGLMFDVLSAQPGAPPVMTGHTHGLITLNLQEADDAVRERTRSAMGEPYRTLLGHFRHEVGHYYWERLVDGTAWHKDFRALFGDERADYAAALRSHYAQGPPSDWALHHVSAYAACHPWEDWAETWAHYLHMVDTLDTALSFGLDGGDIDFEIEAFGPEALWRPAAPGAAGFLEFVNAWVELTGALNELSRSMGQPDFYPFVLPRLAVGKLQFVHAVVGEASELP